MMSKHPISLYLESSNRTLVDLARQAGTTRQSLHRIMRGEQVPSHDLVRRLRSATDGALTVNDFLPADLVQHPAPQSGAQAS